MPRHRWLRDVRPLAAQVVVEHLARGLPPSGALGIPATRAAFCRVSFIFGPKFEGQKASKSLAWASKRHFIQESTPLCRPGLGVLCVRRATVRKDSTEGCAARDDPTIHPSMCR